MSWFNEFCNWMQEHPILTMIFIQIPLCVITSLLTTKLVMWLKS